MGNLNNGNNTETIINCPQHNIPFSGVCGDKNCLKSGLICPQCNPDACTKDKHELLSIDEFYLKFFVKSSGSVDFKKLATLMEDFNKIDRNALTNQVEKFNSRANELIDEKLAAFSKSIGNKMEQMKKNINTRLENLQKEYLEAEARIDLANFEIPENFTLEETKKFFEKNSKSVRDMENMINLVKKYSDNEKLQMNQKDMETIIYSKNISDLNSKEVVEEKMEGIIKDLQEGLSEILNLVKYHKETYSIFFTGVKKFNSNPCELKYKQDITNKCQKAYTIDSVFTAYTTGNDGKAYVAWATPTFAVEIYDLKSNTIAKSLTGHTQHIYIVRHFFYKKTTTDYLISTSYERSCKVWNANTFTLALNIPNCHTGYYLYSALMVFEDSKPWVLTTAPNELTKVWDMNTGKHSRDIASTTDYTYFLTVWYDLKNSGNNIYIINANSADVKMYDFKSGSLHKTFKPDSPTWHMSALVHEINDVPHLFETDGNGYLRIWNILTGSIFKTIHATGCNLRGLCLWNDQYIIAASSDKSFKIFDLNTMTIVASIPGHDNVLCTVDKIVHPTYGEVLLTSAIDGKIKLWTAPNK